MYKQILSLIFFFGFTFFSCQEQEKNTNNADGSNEATKDVRCTWCGMNPQKYPKWSVSVIENKVETMLFCSPRCYFMAKEKKQTKPNLSYFFVEYYSQKRILEDSLFFVLGSNQIGPMGVDFVPILGEKECAEFMKDHAGQVSKKATEIDAKCIEAYAK